MVWALLNSLKRSLLIQIYPRRPCRSAQPTSKNSSTIRRLKIISRVLATSLSRVILRSTSLDCCKSMLREHAISSEILTSWRLRRANWILSSTSARSSQACCRSLQRMGVQMVPICFSHVQSTHCYSWTNSRFPTPIHLLSSNQIWTTWDTSARSRSSMARTITIFKHSNQSLNSCKTCHRLTRLISSWMRARIFHLKKCQMSGLGTLKNRIHQSHPSSSSLRRRRKTKTSASTICSLLLLSPLPHLHLLNKTSRKTIRPLFEEASAKIQVCSLIQMKFINIRMWTMEHRPLHRFFRLWAPL